MGETFQLELRLANWSLNAYENAHLQVQAFRGELKTLDSSLRVETHLNLYPGNVLTVRLPAFTLDRDIADGTDIEFVLLLNAAGIARRDTVRFTVEGNIPDYISSLDIPGTTFFEDIAFLVADSSAVIKASIQGEAVGADLVVRTWPGLEWVGAFPMQPEPGTDHRFVVRFQPATGYYQLSLRLYDAAGGGVFSKVPQRFVVLADPARYPTLVFIWICILYGWTGPISFIRITRMNLSRRRLR